MSVNNIPGTMPLCAAIKYSGRDIHYRAFICTKTNRVKYAVPFATPGHDYDIVSALFIAVSLAWRLDDCEIVAALSVFPICAGLMRQFHELEEKAPDLMAMGRPTDAGQ